MCDKLGINGQLLPVLFFSYTNGSINWKDEEKDQGEQQQLG